MFKKIKNELRYLRLRLPQILLVAFYKLIGPPRILKFNSGNNIAILRAFGATVGNNVKVYSPVVFTWPKRGYANLKIGDNCVINGNKFLDLSSTITLEKGVSLGPGVTIMTHNRYNHNEFLEERLAGTCGIMGVLIKEGAGIKAHALVTMGITIGKNAVAAGGAVVNRDVADNCFVGGVPAKLIKEII